MGLESEKYISFTTYKKSGEAVATPTWIVPVSDGRYGFWTSMGTGKTKRLRNNTGVSVQPCDARGRLRADTSARPGTAEVVQSGTLFDEVKGRVVAKYGLMTKLTPLLAKLGSQGRKGLTYGDTVILIRLDD